MQKGGRKQTPVPGAIHVHYVRGGTRIEGGGKRQIRL